MRPLLCCALLALLAGCEDEGANRCAWKCQRLFQDPPGSPGTTDLSRNPKEAFERYEWSANGKTCCCVRTHRYKEYFVEHAWLGGCRVNPSGMVLPEKALPEKEDQNNSFDSQS